MSSGFKKYSRALTAGQEITINAVGSAFRCTAGDAIFYVEPGESSKVEMQAGIGFAGPLSYQVWRIRNGITAQTIEFYIGDGQLLDNRLVGNIAITGGLKTAANAAGNNAAVVIGTSAAIIKAANDTRSNIVIQNLSSNDLYIGGAAVTVANGIKVAAGSSATVTHAADIYGIASGAGSDVRYLEETV